MNRMCKDVVLIGAGGHGKVIAEIIEKCGDKVIGFLDDNTNLKDVGGYNVLGTVDKCVEWQNCEFIIAIGNNLIRKRIAEKYSFLNYYTAVHPRAVVSENVKIGHGSCVMPNAVINNFAVIGNHCIINTSAVIEHDNNIHDFVHISPNATLCGTVEIGKYTHIGANAAVKNNVSICDNCIIGMCAAVIRNINIEGTYVGIPARKL